MNTIAEQPKQEVMGHNPLIDELEKVIVENLPPVEMPLTHTFTPGLYTREIFMAAGTILTSKIHKTRHVFFILRGKCLVYTKETGPIMLEGPCYGITEPGTRRAIAILEDTTWITVHATTETDLAKIEALLIEPHPIPQRKEIAA